MDLLIIMKKKPFNIVIFFIATIIIMFLTFISFVGFAAKEEGSSGIISNLLSLLHTVLEFPTYTIFWKFIFQSRNFAVYLLAYALNSILYGIIVERLVALIFKNK